MTCLMSHVLSTHGGFEGSGGKTRHVKTRGFATRGEASSLAYLDDLVRSNLKESTLQRDSRRLFPVCAHRLSHT